MAGGMLAPAPARAETARPVSLGDTGARVAEQSFLTLQCLEVARGPELLPRRALQGLGLRGADPAQADEPEDVPAKVYGFAFSFDSDEEPACALLHARFPQPGA
jgi:hypothetical protein